MTDADIEAALGACANDFRGPTADIAMVTGLTPRSRKKVAGLLPATASPRWSTAVMADVGNRAFNALHPSPEERHTISSSRGAGARPRVT